MQPMNSATSPARTPRTFALPNMLTYARIAAVPVVVALMYYQGILDGPLWVRWAALAVFIAASITDVLDGYFARMYGQQSSLGRMLDPIADKLPDRGRGRRPRFWERCHPDRADATLALGHHDAIYGVGLFPRRRGAHDRRVAS